MLNAAQKLQNKIQKLKWEIDDVNFSEQFALMTFPFFFPKGRLNSCIFIVS